MAEMVLPPPLPVTFFHSREPTNLRPHSGGILSINSPSIQGTSCFHIHSLCVCACIREGEREEDMFWTNVSLAMLHMHKSCTLQLFRFNLWSIYRCVKLCVSIKCCSHLRPRLCLAVFLSLGKMSAASHLLPFLSMSACVSVRIHHASLGVDQGENTSLFLPTLPPPAPLALI